MSPEILIKFDDKVQVELLIEALSIAIQKSNGPKNESDYRNLKNNIVLQTSKLNLFQPGK